MTGELLGDLYDKLFDAGALDVYCTPIVMKKNRPAYKISMICKVIDKKKVSDCLFRCSSTIGIREIDISRIELSRDFVIVSTKWGQAKVKRAYLNGEVITATPEFEDLKNLASKANLSVKEISALITAEYYLGRYNSL